MVPRSHSVDENITPFYHIISRCVRCLFLFGKKNEKRKKWLEDRLRFLATWFSIDVLGYTIMDNHFHIVIRLDTPRMRTWSDANVALRWATVFPPLGRNGKKLAGDPLDEWIAKQAQDADFVKKARTTLSNLGCFMKCLKQPLSRMANREDRKKGAFFESRYKSIGISEEAGLLATTAYVDLNPVTAGIVDSPEKAKFTSFHTRLENIQAQGATEELAVAGMEYHDYETAVVVRKAAEVINAAEKHSWLLSINDDRRKNPNARPGMSDRLNLAIYQRVLYALGQKRRLLADAISPMDRARLNRLGLDRDLDGLDAEVQRLETIAKNDLWSRQHGLVEKIRAAANPRDALGSPPPE